MNDDTPAALGALRVDKGKLRGHVDEVVRSSVEETLNGLLDAEANHHELLIIEDAVVEEVALVERLSDRVLMSTPRFVGPTAS